MIDGANTSYNYQKQDEYDKFIFSIKKIYKNYFIILINNLSTNTQYIKTSDTEYARKKSSEILDNNLYYKYRIYININNIEQYVKIDITTFSIKKNTPNLYSIFHEYDDKILIYIFEKLSENYKNVKILSDDNKLVTHINTDNIFNKNYIRDIIPKNTISIPLVLSKITEIEKMNKTDLDNLDNNQSKELCKKVKELNKEKRDSLLDQKHLCKKYKQNVKEGLQLINAGIQLRKERLKK